MPPRRVTVEFPPKPLTATYIVRGRELTVTSLEHGQASARVRLLSPSQLAAVLLCKLADRARDDESGRAGQN